ncbi:MAG: FAD-dependent oxidoreductase [Clostridium sp.]|jgi:thioredoxin reductase/ferredoxin|uniref:FAD-dependent oxidoreductase n=1 Tax=Clostridium sp. TaxID=1506 RepID=UPI0025BE1011|nr:FAD-dependent oxidoreductase [Clostridium sp.]MCH3963338.1 FAD-dependent oxidoreductase [Clostridium sp.]MCI1716794.1 FAD-dependent oxidoreductase [Clostridium sp.]MCI1801022.1 FAD-dependent oxidoreductase [Clostridium sp.]MCI1814980.1 FAD-dependent oxidoreductase [Clostridium sp.]MCI1871881.1 FAD-dependent oxidoreductase [Clostridium sp.]
MQRYDLIVVGAGPAGLSAAIEASKAGMNTIVFDENAKPGGQLFKQIHKFFGSKENMAKVRGFKIGEELLKEAEEYGVEVKLNAVVIGLYPEKEITVRVDDEVFHYKGDAVLIATGASENALSFRGWTLPGVIGAGAAQTMMNLHHIRPGNKVLMVGTGNVGLVVSYQLMQAGCEVTAMVDASLRIGGYGVHAAKVARCGVPFYLSHTIIRAEGKECVTGAEIGEVDDNWKIKPGTEKHFDVDTICIAVGLSPMSQLLKQAGCRMKNTKGGYIPVCNEYGETSICGIFVAGDVSSIEEASSAMIEGRISGIDIAYTLGYLSEEKRQKYCTKLNRDLANLRKGMFAPENRGKLLKKTDENIDISMNLMNKGYMLDNEIFRYPGVVKKSGIHPVMECTQNIPCNPCQDVCPKGCITIGENITSLPIVDLDKTCIGCGMCVASCPGQAIFLVNEDFEEEYASVMIPYEFLPLPEKGEKGKALDRSGKVICEAEVIGVKAAKLFDHTNLLTIKVPRNMAMKARFYQNRRP